ncbi:M23 family metallopeptidase [Candidatus Micrarchaeota archaeon]|nr:M23 family metallopeptidase [Candidatus Micrarchaeota archaeon]
MDQKRFNVPKQLTAAIQWAFKKPGSRVWAVKLLDGSRMPIVRFTKDGQDHIFDPGKNKEYTDDAFAKIKEVAGLEMHPFWELPEFSFFNIIRRNIPAFGLFGAPRFNTEKQQAYTHTGIDTYGPLETPLVAPLDGKVTRIWSHRRAGNVIVLSANGLCMRFLHCGRSSVDEGAKVFQGEKIGELGNTGNALYARPWILSGNGELGKSHLHFEVRDASEVGKAHNPLALIESKQIAIPVNILMLA